MSDSEQNNSSGSTEDQPPSIGSVLREARMSMSLSVIDVAQRIKFAPRQIEALEADDFAHLPEITFVRGFVRSYAKLLQIDAIPLLEALPGTPAPSPQLATRVLDEVPFPSASEMRKPNLMWLGAAAFVIIMAVIFFAWSHGSKPGTPALSKSHRAAQAVAQLDIQQPASAVPDAAATEPAATSALRDGDQPAQQASKQAQLADELAQQGAMPVVSEPAVPDVTPKRPGIIRMEFDEESWVEIKDRDDRILISRLYSPGSEESINGRAPFTFVIGRSAVVRLFYKGKAVDLVPHTKADVARLTLE